MAKATQQDQSKAPTDAELLTRLRRRTKPVTAADLGVSASRLRALDGVAVVGSVKTGKPGRPALLFALDAAEQSRSGVPAPAVREQSDATKKGA